MGFVALTCAVCEGRGKLPGGEKDPILRHIQTCTNCNGEGSIVTHANQIGSAIISVDPSSRSSDETWAIMWERHDNGTYTVHDCGPVKAKEP